MKDLIAAQNIALEQHQHRPVAGHRRYLAVVLTAFVGIVASSGVFVLTLSSEYRLAEAEFQSRATSLLQAINVGLRESSTFLYTIRTYMEATDRPVTREEFENFSTNLHIRVAGLRDTGWAPRISRAERDSFERSVRAAGFPDFQITQPNGKGELVRAGDRDEYFPLLYLDSDAGTRRLLGIDLDSEPVRSKAIAEARASRVPAVTPPMTILSVKRPGGGALAYIAVDEGGRNALVRKTRGIILGVFEIDTLMENIIADRARQTGIDVYLFEPTGPQSARLVYWRPASPTGSAAPSEAAALAGAHWQGTLSIANREWGAVFIPSRSLAEAAWNWHALVPLMAGLMMTAMIVAYLLISLQRTGRLERLTAELRRNSVDLQRNAERIIYMARHDALTGLPNRTLFKERMEQAMVQLRRGVPFAVMCLDLDHFKSVNDAFGHGAGDLLLQQVASRLNVCLREADTIARLGGDEFAVILAGTATAEQVRVVSERLTVALAEAYDLGGQTARIGVSIGVAMAPDDGTSGEVLLVHADRALYAAKAAGRGTYRFFEAAMSAEFETR